MKSILHKRWLSWSAGLVAVLVVSLLGLNAGAGKGPVAGKVTFLKGKAQISKKADGPWKRLKRNKKVHVGDYIRTLDKARLELRYVDKSVMRIAANSTMQITSTKVDSKSQNRTVTASLLAGKAWAKVSKVTGKENKFAINTENAVAGVRGTTFRVNALADKSTLIKVYAGAVAVSNAPYFAKKADEKPKEGPIDFKNRKAVAQPFKEVSKKEWEQLCGEWMSVKVAADGNMAPATKFAAAEDKADEPDWVAWNNERDAEIKTQ